MILLTYKYNNEKFRDELIITNIDCNLKIYHFVKYNDLIKDEFINKVKDFIEKYYLDDTGSFTPLKLNTIINNICKEYNVINLRIERG